MDADQQAGRLTRVRAWWSAKWHDTAAAVFGRNRDGVRLRVVLNPKDAASLYRSLPPAVRLIILSPDRPAVPVQAPRPSSALPPTPTAGKGRGVASESAGQELAAKLGAIEGVEVQRMLFAHAAGR